MTLPLPKAFLNVREQIALAIFSGYVCRVETTIDEDALLAFQAADVFLLECSRQYSAANTTHILIKEKSDGQDH